MAALDADPKQGVKESAASDMSLEMNARTTQCHILLLAAFVASACATSPAARSGGDSTGSGGDGIDTTTTGGAGSAIGLGGDLGIASDGGVTEEPQTCEEAANSRSYVGCEFWPTITANPVWAEFDPAVIVANGGTQDANLVVDGPASFHQEVVVKPGALQTILLKWVLPLKGPEFDVPATSNGRLTASTRLDKGSYKLTSSVPVTAWQFNPLQYTKPGSACPRVPGLTECRSASVDASILLPTTAMTGNYRVFTYSGTNEGPTWGSVPGGIAITATKDGTNVKVELAKKCGYEIHDVPTPGGCVAAGTGVEAKNGGDLYTFTMNAGDVVELAATWAAEQQMRNGDLS